MTQADLAEKMNEQGFRWHGPTVSKSEFGERGPSMLEMLALASIFEVDPAEFYRASGADEVEVGRELESMEERMSLVEELLEALAHGQREFAEGQAATVARLRGELGGTRDGAGAIRRLVRFHGVDQQAVESDLEG